MRDATDRVVVECFVSRARWHHNTPRLPRARYKAIDTFERIKFKPTLLSQRLHRSAPDTVWLNQKSRFKFIPELIASHQELQNVFKSLGIRGSDI